MMKLADADYARAAQLLGCEPAAIRAVAAVESAGDGFLEDGRPKILFEAHHFSRLTGHRFDGSHPEISSPRWNRALYVGGEGEHVRLSIACSLDREAALKSASWGRFQIMGFNFRRCGATTIQEFVNAMYRNEAAQLTAFCHFVKSMNLDDELRALDWDGFARGYNGPGYLANHYDTKLARAYDNFHSIDVTVGAA
jgi:hypothetical protein